MPARDKRGRCALVLGIAGPNPDLGEAELGASAPLTEASAHAEELAASLAAYGYRDVLETSMEPGSAADVAARLDVAMTDPGLVVVHLLTHGDPGRGQTVLYVLGPDGARIQPSVGEWLTRAEERGDDCGPVLFILDVCYAGKVVGYQLVQLVDAERQRAWVLAASSGADPAYDGRLTRALTQVLEEFRSGKLQVDPSVRFIPLRKLFAEVDQLVREQSRGSYPQQVHSSYAPLHADVDHLEFFPNPRWDPGLQVNDARAEVAAGLAALLDEAFDPRHFMRRAGAAEAVHGQIGRGFFHGRAEQLQQLRGWLIGTGPSLCVVTGKPGVGKSALLGVVVCAAHPALREPTRDLWQRLPNMPPPLPEGCLAVVHARRRTVAQVTASIARQWQLPAPGESREGHEWTGQQLIAALARSSAKSGGVADRRLLVVDAVDETDRPAELVAGMLSPLAVARSEDGRPLCRVLVAGREEAHLRPLIDAAAAADGLVDLGAIPRRQLRPALTAYIKDLLGYGTPYETLLYAAAADVLAEAIAGALTAGPGTDADPAPQQWGEFLVAGLYVRHLLDLPPAETLAEARQLGEAVPLDLRGVLDLDLARPAPGLEVRVLRAVARALAFAEGAGMPEQVAERAAAALLADAVQSALSGAETGSALRRLRFYLRRDIDVDGSTLHRLFHQGLADQLRADAAEDATAGNPSPAAQVWQHLYAMIPVEPGGSRQWQHAAPYLLRHAAQHADAAGHLEDLLQDTGFLIRADPDTLAPLVAALPAAAAGGAADTYRASYAAHVRRPPAVRAQIMAIDAARYRHTVLAQRLSQAAIWQPVWASSQSRSASLRMTLTGHTDAVTAVAVGRTGDREVIVSGSQDNTVRVWDAATGQPVGQPLAGHTDAVTAVAVGRAGDREVIVSGSQDNMVRVWDAVTGQPVGQPLVGHPSTVTAVAVGRTGDREVIISRSWDGTVRVWDAATGQPVGRPPVGDPDVVTAVAVGRTGDREVIVSGSQDNMVRVWDAVTGQPVGQPLAGHTDAVTAVAVGRAGDRDVIVSGSQDNTVRVWDAVTGQPVGQPLAGHTDVVTAVAVGRTGDREVIVSGSQDNTVRVWDAATAPVWRVGQPLDGHTDVVTAVAVGRAGDREVIVSGSWDGTVRVWDAATAPVWRVGRPLDGHTQRVTAVAVGRAGDREVIVSGSWDGTVRVWDAATGQPVGRPLDGHTQRVTAVAVGRAGDREVIVSGSQDNTVRVWDAVTGQPVGRPLARHSDAVTAVAVGRAGDREVIVSGSQDNTVRVWDAVTGQPVGQRLDGHSDAVTAVAVGRAGDREVIVSGSQDNTVRVWDAVTGQPVGRPLAGHTDAVTAVAVGRAGDREVIVSGGWDEMVRVWDAVTGQPVGRPLAGHTDAVTAVAVGRAGDREVIVSGGWDGTVRVWDAATGQPVGQQHFPDAVQSVALGNERLVAAQGNDVVALRTNPAILSVTGVSASQESAL